MKNYATLDEIVDLFCKSVDKMPPKERAVYIKRARAQLAFAFLKLELEGKAN